MKQRNADYEEMVHNALNDILYAATSVEDIEVTSVTDQEICGRIYLTTSPINFIAERAPSGDVRKGSVMYPSTNVTN